MCIIFHAVFTYLFIYFLILCRAQGTSNKRTQVPYKVLVPDTHPLQNKQPSPQLHPKLRTNQKQTKQTKKKIE